MFLSLLARALTWTQSSISGEFGKMADGAWEDLQRRIAENPQISLCKACDIRPKKTRDLINAEGAASEY